MTRDPLQARLDALWDAHDSPVTGDVQERQRTHLAFVMQYSGRAQALFELCFDTLVEIVAGLNYADKSHWPKHRGTQLVLFLHNLKTLESAEDRLMKGCYGDAFVLLRVPYEAFLRLVFMSLFPADAMSALANPTPGHRVFNATNLIQQDLCLRWSEHTLLSVFTHAHQFPALAHVVAIAQGSRDPIMLDYHFDEAQFTVGVNLLTVVYYMFLGMVVHVFGNVTGPPELVKDIRKAREFADLAGAMLRTHGREHLPAVVDDLDDVFRLMQAADEGKHWKFAWWRIRVLRVLKRMLARRDRDGEPGHFTTR